MIAHATIDSTELKTSRSREPKYSKFSQQELPAFRPLLTPKWVLGILFAIGLTFVPIGIGCIVTSRSVVMLSARYDHVCLEGVPSNATDAERDAALTRWGGEGEMCRVLLVAPRHMRAPVFMYYELDSYYQNHRRYVKSRSDPQLRGSGAAVLEDCRPQEYEGGDAGRPANPCGLVAWSLFNDSFSILAYRVDASTPPVNVTINQTGIAWKTDRQQNFGAHSAANFNAEPVHRGGATVTGPLSEAEHLMVWMRTAALPSFRKLWGRIEADVPAGTRLSVHIQNRYNTYRFGGQKRVVFSTTSWLGGRNDFLGAAYLAVGGAAFVAALGFAGALTYWPRRLGDVRLLSWNKVKLS